MVKESKLLFVLETHLLCSRFLQPIIFFQKQLIRFVNELKINSVCCSLTGNFLKTSILLMELCLALPLRPLFIKMGSIDPPSPPRIYIFRRPPGLSQEVSTFLADMLCPIFPSLFAAYSLVMDMFTVILDAKLDQ